MRVRAATNQHIDDAKSANTGARLACAAAAAAALVAAAASSATAAGDSPSYPPWSFFNMTPYQVELFFTFADCDSQFGGVGAYQQYTYPFPRGACNVANIHTTAFVQDKPGGDPRIVATADWSPSAPNSQEYSQWVVMQLAPDAPSIRVAHILD